jgi:hypothetical protein
MSAEPCTDAQDAAGSLMVENLVAADPQIPDTRSSCRLAAGNKMVARLGVVAKLGFKAHPHMFRHACGFQLANQGADTRTLQAVSRPSFPPPRGRPRPFGGE